MMGASSSAVQATKQHQQPHIRQIHSKKGLDDGIGNIESSRDEKNESEKEDSQKQPKQQSSDDEVEFIEADKNFFASKKLHLSENSIQLARNIMKKNKDLANALRICRMAVTHLADENESDTDMLRWLEKIDFMFFDISSDQRTAVGDFLKHINFCPLSFKKYKQLLKSSNMNSFKESSSLETETSQVLYLVRSLWWNFSDCSASFASSLLSNKIVQEMISDLQSLINIEGSVLKNSFTFESAIGALHNVAKTQDHRQTFRDLKLGEILGEFLKYEELPKITMLVLLTLALVIDEDQTHLLFSHESSFDLMLQLATRAWKSKEQRYDGFSTDELLLGLKGLSKNDKVKRLLVEKGILELVRNILGGGKEDIKDLGAQLLWELSFDPTNKKLILEDHQLMSNLKSMTKSSGKIARSSQGALWVLEMENKVKRLSAPEEEISRAPSSKTSGHVMISYNWSTQKQLIEVRDRLKSNGYRVWMDIDNLTGSTLGAMAEAVEGSSVVLVCMSEKYKESKDCRSEAEYAYKLNKPIIPLIMQEKYKPDGWLGILLGAKLFFDFTNKHKFESKINELVKELVGRGLGSDGDVTDGPIIKTAAPIVGKVPKPKEGLSLMEVKSWIIEHKLDKYPVFSFLEPAHLHFLEKLSMKAPEFYYSLLMDLICEKISIENLNALMKVTDAINKLPT